jgi:type I restriction enzyme R subunit
LTADVSQALRENKGLDAEAEQIVLQDYFDDGSGKAPRYYQVNAALIQLRQRSLI